VVGAKLKPVAIGRLERFVADIAMGRGWDEIPEPPAVAQKTAAIIGSGPSGLACAGELARNGVKVTIFEALHVAGGVLKYGIPEFRLPDIIIDAEIENLKKMGVEIRLDSIIGKLFHHPATAHRERASTPLSWAPAPDRPNSPKSPARRSTASSAPTNS
jgi:glutamate synthase (NADPH) small chain